MAANNIQVEVTSNILNILFEITVLNPLLYRSEVFSNSSKNNWLALAETDFFRYVKANYHIKVVMCDVNSAINLIIAA